MSKLLSRFAVVAALLFASGCAHQVLISPSQGAVATPSAKIPMDIGLFMSDVFRNYQHSEGKMGDTWNFSNFGQASANQFRHALEQRFRKVTLLQSKSVDLASSNVTFIVEPEFSSYTFDIPITKFQIYPATVRYKISAIGAGGKVIYSNVVSGVGDTSGSPGFDFSANPARSASKAVEVGVNAAIDDLVNSMEFKQLLQGAPQGGNRPGQKTL